MFNIMSTYKDHRTFYTIESILLELKNNVLMCLQLTVEHNSVHI